jgi:tRNA-splicing ligase RtcB (3'-phosphate/5'-hydroxy nucleic acid ligase)
MEKVNDKLYNWASSLEPEALLQAERTARLPVVDRVALMPDAHFGMGATVGSVIATENVVIPAAVGVDIGCGMIAAQLALTSNDLPDDLAPFLDTLERVVPAGVGRGHVTQSPAAIVPWRKTLLPSASVNLRDSKLMKTAASQLGSLGSGNHFFEVCLDEDDGVWVVLHSGSRGIGNKLAQLHIKVAKKLARANSTKLEDQDLAYLEGGTPEFDAYIYDMLWAQDYAAANREVMMDEALREFTQLVDPLGQRETASYELQRINCHHNFTQREVHDGRELWITRKGAIKAAQGDYGVIPGSMGTRSYIVRGLGESTSFNSCSHGAGRRMSRAAAKKRFTTADLTEVMGDRVWLESKAESLIDEIPMSYKDIDRVMYDQRDLVYPIAILHQVLNYKGA